MTLADWLFKVNACYEATQIITGLGELDEVESVFRAHPADMRFAARCCRTQDCAEDLRSNHLLWASTILGCHYDVDSVFAALRAAGVE